MSFFHYERLIVDLLMRKLRHERPVLLTGKAFSGYRQKYRSSLIVASTMSHALRDYFGFLEEKVPKCYLSGSDF